MFIKTGKVELEERRINLGQPGRRLIFQSLLPNAKRMSMFG